MNKDKVYSFIGISTILTELLGFMYGFFRVIAYAFDIVQGSDLAVLWTMVGSAILLVMACFTIDLGESNGWFDWPNDSEEEEES